MCRKHGKFLDFFLIEKGNIQPKKIRNKISPNGKSLPKTKPMMSLVVMWVEIKSTCSSIHTPDHTKQNNK
jgi:hypothetical protein